MFFHFYRLASLVSEISFRSTSWKLPQIQHGKLAISWFWSAKTQFKRTIKNLCKWSAGKCKFVQRLEITIQPLSCWSRSFWSKAEILTMMISREWYGFHLTRNKAGIINCESHATIILSSHLTPWCVYTKANRFKQ